MLPLALSCGDKGASDDSAAESDTDTDTDSDSDTDTDTGSMAVCGEFDEATSSRATAGIIGTKMDRYLVCAALEKDGSCPDYTVLPSSFIEDTTGNPWNDPFCWYSAEAVCGPETSISDRYCYEFVFQGIICA